jgi:hypothetical protein
MSANSATFAEIHIGVIFEILSEYTSVGTNNNANPAVVAGVVFENRT